MKQKRKSTTSGQREDRRKKSRTFVALLRGINVGGHKKIPMAELRATCADLGCEHIQTYIQSGNVVLASTMPANALESRLEEAIEHDFHCSVPVIVRSASSWQRYVESMPFVDEAERESHWILLAVSKLPPDANVAAKLQDRATLGERVIPKGDCLWIHYAKGVARSKLTPAVLDRLVGSPVTARNWKTVCKINEMMCP